MSSLMSRWTIPWAWMYPIQHQIHHVVEYAALFVYVEIYDADKVWVAQTSQQSAFCCELLSEELRAVSFERVCLERIVDSKRDVFDLEYGTHAALPEWTQDAVGADFIIRLNVHHHLHSQVDLVESVISLIHVHIIP